MTASVLGLSGMPMVELAGERAWRIRTIGDIVCSFQWIDIGDDEPAPCMTLFPAQRHMDTAAYVIPQKNAYAYAQTSGEPTPMLIGTAFKAAMHMGFHPDSMTVKRIIDIIVDGIPDLIRMPSDQPDDLSVQRTFYGMEATAKVNGRTIREEVL